jgi:hypothetical protein
MFHLLSNPKVRLGLLVNGLYLLSLTLLPLLSGRGQPTVYADRRSDDSATSGRPTVYVSLPPPAGTLKATSHQDKGGINVYLEQDLTLSGARGSRLLLSPIFTLREDEETPNSVLLRFVSFSDEQLLSNGDKLVISADGKQVWPTYWEDGTLVWESWTEDTIPPFATPDEQGGVVENIGKAIPYEVFADVIRAKRVVFNLGPHLVELNAGQLEALRDLHRLIPRLRTERSNSKRF